MLSLLKRVPYHEIVPRFGSPKAVSGAPGSELEREVVAVYEQCSAELLAYGSSMTGNADSALDAVQETFLRYIVERRHGRRIESPRAWLYRVLRHYLLDRFDAASVRREVATEDLTDVPDGRHDPESLLQQAQMAEEVTLALTPREMECLRLRASGLSYAEIAGQLGIQAGTVSALLTRVHKKLRGPDGDCSGLGSGTREALCFLFREGEGYSY
jgi:RNA polymerase sigma factor (sigma-70 family)